MRVVALRRTSLPAIAFSAALNKCLTLALYIIIIFFLGPVLTGLKNRNFQ
jgi:hypothetical protein